MFLRCRGFRYVMKYYVVAHSAQGKDTCFCLRGIASEAGYAEFLLPGNVRGGSMSCDISMADAGRHQLLVSVGINSRKIM